MKKILKCIFVLIVIFIFNIHIQAEVIDYTETLESFDNPERGFYQYFYYDFKNSGNELSNNKALNENLIHLRLGIGAFSKAVNGVEDLEFSSDMLNTFSNILKQIKNNGGTAIIRFAYDNFDGKKDMEPRVEMILKHIEQLKPILNENKDAISYIELGFFGPWGEMHSSSICTTDNVSKAIDSMLDSAPENIKIGVRTPEYYTAWANIERNELNKSITYEGSKTYRIGLYNDGYLGSDSDLGTFKNREVEIQWLEKQALHTFYGGEVVSNKSSAPINTSNYMINESFRTHTTYLNKAYDKNVIDSWKNELYEGNNLLYKGQSGYTYILNHLGYRFVLRNSLITQSIEPNQKLNLLLDIENVGFGNLINNKIVTLLFVKDDIKYEIKTNIDPTKWNSRMISKINLEVELPKNISVGEWKVYLRISQYGNFNSDNNYLCIRLANNNIWNEEIGANYIGTFNVIQKENKMENEQKEKNDPVPQYKDEENIKVDNDKSQENNRVYEDKIDNNYEVVAGKVEANYKINENKFEENTKVHKNEIVENDKVTDNIQNTKIPMAENLVNDELSEKNEESHEKTSSNSILYILCGSIIMFLIIIFIINNIKTTFK